MTANDIEIAVARFFNPRVNIIVPNVSWGFGLRHECDLLIVTPGRYATEIEIKVTRSDIKADLRKRWQHRSDKIRRFSYAVPEELADCPYLPLDCGLLIVEKDLRVKVIRPPRHNKYAVKLTDKQVNKLLHLGCMRIWSLKEAVMTAKKRRRAEAG